MNLNDAQKAQLQKWIEEGCRLSEIQSKLNSELGIKLTYMETRLLMDDLKIQPQDQNAEREELQTLPHAASPEGDSLSEESEAAAPDPGLPSPNGTFSPPGDVSVKVDQVTRAGAIVSGRVTFSDGRNADWYLDQYGRLSLAPQEQGYRPSQADLMLFQGELQSELAKMGY